MLLVPTYLAPSSIHGFGVFATANIPRGTIMWRFQEGLDLALDDAFIAGLPEEARNVLLTYCYRSSFLGNRLVLNFDNARYINHSDTANTENATELAIARVDIAAGAEITCDYNEVCLDHEGFGTGQAA
jgi:hypothetical protein